MANKKNADKLVWPEGYFTINDIFTKYPDMVEITLRFRIKKAQENKEIVAIGRLKPSIGRPKLVFAKAGYTKELVKKAYSEGVLPPKDDNVSIPVANVQAPTSVEQPVQAEAHPVTSTSTVAVTS